MAGSKQESGEDGKIPASARPAYEAVVALTDAFCRDRLTEEYEALCRKLAGALARKRPSPLLGARRRPGPAGSSARSAGSTTWTTRATSRT